MLKEDRKGNIKRLFKRLIKKESQKRLMILKERR